MLTEVVSKKNMLQLLVVLHANACSCTRLLGRSQPHRSRKEVENKIKQLIATIARCSIMLGSKNQVHTNYVIRHKSIYSNMGLNFFCSSRFTNYCAAMHWMQCILAAQWIFTALIASKLHCENNLHLASTGKPYTKKKLRTRRSLQCWILF